MDGLHRPRALHRTVRAASWLALSSLLASCITLEEIAIQSGADPVTWALRQSDDLACHVPEPAGHVHPPGDPAWVGHGHSELVAALGPPAFQIGKPNHVSDGPDYLVAVYADSGKTRSGCIDAYTRNPCGVITMYHCR
ncbi:MAG: hypothetical protein R3298_00280 [Gammaproteobacteria bacterium]|nr:hypothetical protein [Gammaproteobacteria bacterium]